MQSAKAPGVRPPSARWRARRPLRQARRLSPSRPPHWRRAVASACACRHAGIGFADDLAQPSWSGSADRETRLDGHFGRHFDRGRGQDERAAISGKFLTTSAGVAPRPGCPCDGENPSAQRQPRWSWSPGSPAPAPGRPCCTWLVSDRRQHRTRRRQHGSRQPIGFAVALRDWHSELRPRRAGCATGAVRTDQPVRDGHSKTAMLKSEHAARTSISARTSSTVSMTTMASKN